MLFGLLAVLIIVLILPFLVKKVEHNLEIFLFVMGLLATIVAGTLSLHLAGEILTNHLLYLITGAVLVAGILFKVLNKQIRRFINAALVFMPLRLLIFLIIVILGLASSFITAIIAALLLVELIAILPLPRKDEVKLTILSCFAIGLGAVLTPVGEPLSTIVVSKLDQGFWYLLQEVGVYILPGVVALGLLGAIMIKAPRPRKSGESRESLPAKTDQLEVEAKLAKEETYPSIFLRAAKILVFIIALELLGAGFKPIIDAYVIHWDSRLLYWVNMISAILDNATLAAAEISIKMNAHQIQAILMGLLISGGMLIPGNIPNIISAGKLKIGSREWAKLGVPVGLIVMAIYFVIIFVL